MSLPLGAGTYWVELSTDDTNRATNMLETIPHPLAEYDESRDGGVTWSKIRPDPAGYYSSTVGFRVYGSAVVPEAGGVAWAGLVGGLAVRRRRTSELSQGRD